MVDYPVYNTSGNSSPNCYNFDGIQDSEVFTEKSEEIVQNYHGCYIC